MNLEENNYDYIAGSNFLIFPEMLIGGEKGDVPPPQLVIFLK